MKEQPAESTATTAASVTPGLGYPNHRDEESPTPTGWHGINQENFTNVSRETSESE
jgi:hypothetical protein